MNNRRNLLIAAVVALVVLSGVIAYMAYHIRQQKKESDQMLELAEMDKREMENEYEQFAMQYNEMKMQINNDSLVAQLESVPAVHEEVQARTSAFYDLHRRDFLSIRTNYVCGFEQAYGIACEGALKFGETIKIPSFAFEAEEYNHGPNLQLTPAYTLFFVDDLSQGSARMHQLYQAARHVSDHAFFLSGDAAQGDPNVFEIPADRPAEALLEPLYLLPFFQICAYRATDELGTWEENPLLKEAKKYAPSKTENILKVMPLL